MFGNRRYNIMKLTAEQRVQELRARFEKHFYAREIENARKQFEIAQAAQEVLSGPEPEQFPAEPEFEDEVSDG